jgi:hypothetical protein
MYNKDWPKYHEYRVILGRCSVETTKSHFQWLFPRNVTVLGRAILAYSARLTKNIPSPSCVPSLDNSSASANNSFEAYDRPTHRPFLNPKPYLYRPCRRPYPAMGSVVLPHLVSGWHVDQAIMSEEERLVIIRFGRDWDPECMRQDEVLYRKRFLFPFTPHLLILHIYRHRRSSQELCRHLCVRSRPGPRLQADVR